MPKPSRTESTLFLFTVLAVSVYGAIAAEIWMIGGNSWEAMFLVLGVVVATAFALVRIFDGLLDQGGDERAASGGTEADDAPAPPVLAPAAATGVAVEETQAADERPLVAA